MQIGMVGLGRMGANMTRRLLKGGHRVVVFNRSPKPIEELVKENATGAATCGIWRTSWRNRGRSG